MTEKKSVVMDLGGGQSMKKRSEGFQRGKNKLLGVMHIFTVLIVVMIAQVNAYAMTYQQYTLCLLHCTSIVPQ